MRSQMRPKMCCRIYSRASRKPNWHPIIGGTHSFTACCARCTISSSSLPSRGSDRRGSSIRAWRDDFSPFPCGSDSPLPRLPRDQPQPARRRTFPPERGRTYRSVRITCLLRDARPKLANSRLPGGRPRQQRGMLRRGLWPITFALASGVRQAPRVICGAFVLHQRWQKAESLCVLAAPGPGQTNAGWDSEDCARQAIGCAKYEIAPAVYCPLCCPPATAFTGGAG